MAAESDLFTREDPVLLPQCQQRKWVLFALSMDSSGDTRDGQNEISPKVTPGARGIIPESPDRDSLASIADIVIESAYGDRDVGEKMKMK